MAAAGAYPLTDSIARQSPQHWLGVSEISSQANTAAAAIAWHSPLLPLFEAADRLVRLPEGWDSYGAPRINLFYVQRAVELVSAWMRRNLPIPSLVPTTAGGVQLEWHTRGIDLEIKVESASTLGVFFEDHLTGETYEEDQLGPSSLVQLDRFIADLVQRS